MGRVQQPIKYFRGARDAFMVHDVNNPLVAIISNPFDNIRSQAPLFYLYILGTNQKNLLQG